MPELAVPAVAPAAARLPRDERRKTLLAAAQEIFVAQGYHAAAMDDIAERAGVSKPVLYQHFPSKMELYLALLDAQTEALSAAVAQAIAATDDNQQRIHGVVSAYFDFVDGEARGDDGAFRLIFETDLVNEPGVRERVDRMVEQTMRAAAATVAAETGFDTASAELLSVALIGAGQVAARWWLADKRRLPKQTAIALIESLLWRGISNFPLKAD
jgi:AcrR family transcriptional regulator